MSDQYFKGQSLQLGFELETDQDLTEADEVKVLWKNRKESGSWAATADGNTIVTEKEKIDEEGVWQFQAYARFGTEEYFSKLASIRFYNNLNTSET